MFDRQSWYTVMTMNQTKRKISEVDDLTIQQAYQEALDVRAHAYTPYSGFKVGAALVYDGGMRIQAGCNVENASFGATIRAERNAVIAAIALSGCERFDALVVVADTDEATPPCALCLQVLSEFCSPDMPVYLGDLSGGVEQYRFDELLPYPFNGSSLARHQDH